MASFVFSQTIPIMNPRSDVLCGRLRVFLTSWEGSFINHSLLYSC